MHKIKLTSLFSKSKDVDFLLVLIMILKLIIAILILEFYASLSKYLCSKYSK